jgi:hypothetical protein
MRSDTSEIARCLDAPRVSLRPVIAAASDQPHAVAVAIDTEAVAVILDPT